MARTVLEVFLSSTAADLQPHREAIYARLARIEFIKCIRQEDFGAQSAETVAYCCTKASGADLFIGLIGMRRGWEPNADTKHSITEMEYDAAKGRRRLLWLSPDDFPVPGNLHESAAEHRRQLAFRKRVSGEHIISQGGFASPEALASEIVEQLLTHIVTGDLIERLRAGATDSATAPIEDQTPAVAAAVEKLVADHDVDLLALARDPKGIDIADLERKLTARAEQHEADSQRARKASAEYWRHIGALAFHQDTAKALTAYQRAVALNSADTDGWRYLGELQFRRGDLAGAADSFAALVERAKDATDRTAESTGCVRLGWIYHNEGDLARAEAITMKALRLAQGWDEGTARAYANLGLIHRTRGDLAQAEAMHRKALALEQKLGNKHGMAAAYANLGNVHYLRDNLAEAEAMHRKALALNEELDRKEGMAIGYGNLGNLHQSRGDLRGAEALYRKALALEEELGRKEGMAITYENLGKVYEKKKQKKRMCMSWRKSRDLWRDMGLTDRAAEIERWLQENCED